MALRIGAPPVWVRLRMVWHSLRLRGYSVQRTVLELREGMHIRAEARTRAMLQQHMSAFSEHYEELIDLLCSSAREGVFPDKENRYARLRRTMMHGYPAVRQALRIRLGDWCGPLDPFEELFMPDSLHAVINDAAVIENVVRTRSALEDSLQD